MKVGPAWTERGRPPAGFFTKRTAEAWLRDVLDRARRGTLPGLVRTARHSPTRRSSTCAMGRTTELQAVDAARLLLDDPGAPASSVRIDARRGHRCCDDRALACSASVAIYMSVMICATRSARG
jgi:hypothetical protein